MYSSGTQYSDPVYEAVNKIDRTPMTNNELYSSSSIANQSFDLDQIGEHLESTTFSTPDWDERDDELSDFTMIPPVSTVTTAPPLPPRNATTRQPSFNDTNRPIVNRTNKSNIDRLKVATKLYENVIENRTYDAELLAFFNMVCYQITIQANK